MVLSPAGLAFGLLMDLTPNGQAEPTWSLVATPHGGHPVETSQPLGRGLSPAQRAHRHPSHGTRHTAWGSGCESKFARVTSTCIVSPCKTAAPAISYGAAGEHGTYGAVNVELDRPVCPSSPPAEPAVSMWAMLTRKSIQQMGRAPGQPCLLSFKTMAVTVTPWR